MADKKKVAFYGFGVMDAGIAAYFDSKFSEEDIDMLFFDINPEINTHFQKHRQQPDHFPDIKFSEKVNGTDSIEELVEDAEHIIIGIPSLHIRKSVQEFAQYLTKPSIITIVSKGLEQGTNKRLSEVVREELESNSKYQHGIAVFSGGTIADDIARRRPLVATVASENRRNRKAVTDLFHSETLRVYTTNDVIGTELSGALKNCISIGAGICEGLGFYTGTISSYIIRASTEIQRIAEKMGAKDETFSSGSPAFWGDIMLSCFGETRNREYGRRICQEVVTPLDVLEQMGQEHKTVEGYYTITVARELAKKHFIEAPCIEQIYKILYENEKPINALKNLMGRRRHSLSVIK